MLLIRACGRFCLRGLCAMECNLDEAGVGALTRLVTLEVRECDAVSVECAAAMPVLRHLIVRLPKGATHGRRWEAMHSDEAGRKACWPHLERVLIQCGV